MKKELDINNWNRKEHFKFFNSFTEPFYGVCITVDCTKAYQYAKENGHSFFLYYLHKSLAAANNIEPFRYRIEENQVFVYDKINASPTINRPNGTFGFGYMEYYEDFALFVQEAKKEIERIQNTTALLPSATYGENLIHYSSIPWIDFQSLSHARNFAFPDSCPKISFGKMTKNSTGLQMPVSIHVNHALMDGYHVGQFIDLYQQLLNE